MSLHLIISLHEIDYSIVTFNLEEHGVSVKTSEKTSVKILQTIEKNHKVTINNLSKHIGGTTRFVERNIKKLQDAGKLKRIGPDKGGY